MDKQESTHLLSNACPPVFSDDSLFFNLILGTTYENTKENCLLFLKITQEILFFQKEKYSRF